MHIIGKNLQIVNRYTKTTYFMQNIAASYRENLPWKISTIDIFEDFNNILRMICRIYQKNELTLHSKYK